MSPDTLREGAIVVADAHCAPWRTPFLDFLKALDSGHILAPQLILMGDLFDLLFGPIPATRRLNREAIDILDRLSQRIEIIYLEGNHDFLLGDVFPHIRVFRREEQPWIARYEGKRIAFAHGDRFMGKGYELYTRIIRNGAVLALLRTLDTIGGGFIVRFLERAMQRKHHCKTIERFEELIESRAGHYSHEGIDWLVEGHFHQNRTFDASHFHYVNVGAFACNERYFSVQSTQNQPLLREAVFRKEPV